MKLWKSTMLTLLIASIVSCGPGQKKSEKGGKEVQTSIFPQTYESTEKEIKGGTLKIAVMSSSPMKGILSGLLQEDGVDSKFTLTTIEPNLFANDENFMVTDEGLAKIDIDLDNKIVTLTLRDNLKWDDGQPMTIDDYIFAYEVIAHKDYTGVRYDESMQKIVGMKEYHEGKAKTISGLEKVSDTQVKIHFTEMSPAMRMGGGGLCSVIAPKHDLKDIPVKDLVKSDKVRLNVVGAGPWKIKHIVPGESIEFVPNEYYYKPEEIPKVDSLIMKIIPDSSIISSMKSGEFDIYKNITESIYEEYKDFDNLAVLGRAALYYSYLGFNLGHWDAKQNKNIPNPNAKMADINLRKAMGYAMNVELVNQNFYHGLRERANSPIPPVFAKLYDGKKRFSYNPEKAKELLDKAGYKDVNGDGIREDKNGKPLEIFYAMSAGGDIAEPLAQQYIQDWANVGLKVSLVGGRLLDFNSMMDRVQANDKAIDMWTAAWGVGTAMDLNGLYAEGSAFNLSRMTTPKNDELIKKVNSIEALKDKDLWIKFMREWEDNYMENVLGFLPLQFRYELTPINKRVKFYTVSVNPEVGRGKALSVTKTEPFKSTK